eukprot:gene1760-2100_t
MAEEMQVMVRFTTRLPPELQVPLTEVAVPASLKRYGLSQIINHLLALDPARPFDFIIAGELVRKSLQQHLLDHSISPELLVEVEYVPAVVPPEPRSAMPQDDWVTAVVAAPGAAPALASGAADGIIRIWNGNLCCSGGWDGQLLLWRSGQQLLEESAGEKEPEAAAAQHTKKKRKTENAEANGVPMRPVQLQPTASLTGHIHCVAAVSWPEANTLYSGGWDHSVRRYDVETQTNTDTYNGSKAVYAVAAACSDSSSSSPMSSDIVALGGSDKVLRIWDSRSVKGEALAVRAYAGHEGWISSLAWRPGSSFHVASGGHDGAVKLWDIRTAVPLGSLQQHSDAKVLCLGWLDKKVLVSGGSDCKLQLYDLP